MKHLLNNIKIGVLEFNLKLECIFMNNYMIDNFDILKKEQVNSEYILNNYEKIVHPDDVMKSKPFAEQFFKNQENSENECRIKNKKTGDYIWYTVKKIFSEKSYIYTFEDINNLKLLEQKLIQEKDKAFLNYNHKSIFIANINHELITPMNGIIGMLTLLEDTVLNNDQKDYIEMMRECSVNLMSVISDILDYNKLESGKVKLNIECINIRETIESTNDIVLSKMYEKNLEYNYKIDSDLVYNIKSDKNRIKQVLLNLLSNSIKFTDQGNIFLDISIIENNFIKFTITDTGCGLDIKDQDKLFKSFSQLDNHPTKIYKGTGLGLAISKELVLLMGGKIWVEQSEINKGSTFCFTIKAEECINPNQPSVDFNPKILNNKKVFILDDKRENRISCANILQKWGIKVTTYSDPSEALYFLKSEIFDCGIVDFVMPYMSGPKFATNLKQQISKQQSALIPLISASSLGENYNNTELFKGHLIKPLKESKLKKMLIDIFESTTYKYKKDPSNTNPINSTYNFQTYINTNELNYTIKENIRILLVEDIPINQKVVLNFLNKMGFKNIDIVDDGIKCLEKMCINKYDIILLDIRIPRMNGESVLKYIIDYYSQDNKEFTYKISNSRKPYIIAVTAYCLKEDKDKYINLGFDDYIPKPVNINELNSCINIFIEKILQD